MNLTKKDIILFNKKFDNGIFANESSLDFTLSVCKKNIAWSKKLAYLIRAILIDHVFEDGNKRTTCAVIYYCIENNGYLVNEKKTVNMIKNILLNNIISIKKIRWMIEDGLSKKN